VHPGIPVFPRRFLQARLRSTIFQIDHRGLLRKTVKALVEGAQRAQVVNYTDCGEYYEAVAVALVDTML